MKTPTTDSEWFELIEPEIDADPIDPDPEVTVQLAKIHAEQVVERTELNVDLSRIDWQATWRLKTKHGFARGSYINNQVKLSLHSLETNGWQWFMETVRHELIHVWQHQNGKYDRTADTEWARAHGKTFEQWASKLDVKKRGGSVLSVWTIHCPECDSQIGGWRKRRKHQIARQLEKDSFSCPYCDMEPSEYIIKKDGEPIDLDRLPEVNVPSEGQKRIFLYNRASSETTDSVVEWDPYIKYLTRFTGIGEATADKIGGDIQVIDDLVAGEDLSDKVLKAVSSRYYDELRDEVFSTYDEALEHRSGEDLDLLEKVKEQDESNWWQQIEKIGGTGDIEAICDLLRNEISIGDRLVLAFKNTDERYQAQVVGGSYTKLTVELEPLNDKMESKATIHIPEPPRGKFPKLGPGPDANILVFPKKMSKITHVQRKVPSEV